MLHDMALNVRRPGRAARLMGTTVGQLAPGAPVVASVTTVIAMPQADSLGTQLSLVLGVCIVAVVTDTACCPSSSTR